MSAKIREAPRPDYIEMHVLLILIIIIIGVFWTQDAVILFVKIPDLGSELFSDRLILPELWLQQL